MSTNMALKALLTLAFLAAGSLALNEQCGAGNETCTGSRRRSVADVVTKELFDNMLLHRNNPACPANGFYTYEAFIAAADAFPRFGTTGSRQTRRREVCAFLAQTAHETRGGWETAPDGPFAWGYCFKERPGAPNCLPSAKWPCVPGKYYFGRGPFLMSYNTNYGPAGEAIGVDLMNNPELVSTDPIISFKTALWIWTREQRPKPSCHAVMTGQWTPTTEDIEAGRVPGFGATTNIINGQVECGNGPDERGKSRIGFYKEFCGKLRVSYGLNLDCYNQTPFAQWWLAQ